MGTTSTTSSPAPTHHSSSIFDNIASQKSSPVLLYLAVYLVHYIRLSSTSHVLRERYQEQQLLPLPEPGCGSFHFGDLL